MAEGEAAATNWYEPRPRRGAALRYGVSAVLVAAAAASAAELLTLAPDGPVATDVPDAVMVDLPALSSSQPPSDAPEGPPEEAVPAAPAAPPPPPVAAPPPEVSPEVPPPPEAPHPDAALEKREDAAPTPPPPAAAVAQEETAPNGAAAPAADAVGEAAAAAAPDAHAIAAWQRAMVGRLESAKHRDPHRPHASGTADVAFRIDRAGHLVSRAIERSSGSAALDAAALALVAAAAPFPAPPPGLDDAALAFTVPVRFNPRR